MQLTASTLALLKAQKAATGSPLHEIVDAAVKLFGKQPLDWRQFALGKLSPEQYELLLEARRQRSASGGSDQSNASDTAADRKAASQPQRGSRLDLERYIDVTREAPDPPRRLPPNPA